MMYLKGRTYSQLIQHGTEPHAAANAVSSSSSSSSSSANIILTPIDYLKDAPRITEDDFEKNLTVELMQAITMKAKHEAILNKTRKRRRNETNATILDTCLVKMRDATRILNSMEDDIIIGCVEENENSMNLARPTAHHSLCRAQGCHNGQETRILCLTCPNGYCTAHASSHQTKDLVVIGSDYTDVQLDKRDGGFIICHECSDSLSKSRVINIPAICETEKYTPQRVDTGGNSMQCKDSKKHQKSGTDHHTLTGMSMATQYRTSSTSIPQVEEGSVPHTVKKIPPLKKVKEKIKRSKNRMTNLESNLECPGGCGDPDCHLSTPDCHAQYPIGGWEGIQRLRDALKEFEIIDQKWNFVLQHVRHQKITESNQHTKFLKIDCPVEVQTERETAGVHCKFCSRVTDAILTECGVNDAATRATLLANIKKHERRGTTVCGEEMYRAGKTYLDRHSASSKSTCFLPTIPGCAHKKVSQPFFARTFGIPLRTLQNQIKKKREGRLSSTQVKDKGKGGKVGLTDLQLKRMEAVMGTFEQSQSHYKPASQKNHYRFEERVSISTFWYKYCELWSQDFYKQCERLDHKFGLDDNKTRPTDEVYLKDAEQNANIEEYEEIEAIYDSRRAMEVDIAALTTSMADLAAANEDDNEAEYQRQADAKLTLESQLKNGRKCNMKDEEYVSYSGALKFYRLYILKFGIIKVDTCKFCESKALEIQRTQSATKKAELEAELKIHHDMADVGYKWRKQDRIDAQLADSKTQMLVIDYGQGLRTPMLNIGTSWYRRVWKVSPYIIVSYSKNGKKDVKYYLSDETTCGKGADEVISYTHHNILANLEDDTDSLVIHFDGAAGQAANINMMCFLADLLDPSSPMYIPQLKRIVTKRNPVGHTYCECDTVHAEVSKQIRKLSKNGVVHCPYNFPNQDPGIVTWQMVIEACGFECVVVTQEMVLNYTEYLLGGGIYKKSIANAFDGVGSKVGDDAWKISHQHIVEYGVIDDRKGARPESQTSFRGIVRTSATWNLDDVSWVRLWREKGDKARGTFRIDSDNIEQARQAMRPSLDIRRKKYGYTLPKRKYLQKMKLCVLKMYDLFNNARDCGFGLQLITIYPALTTAQLVEWAKKKKERKDSKVDDGYRDE